MSPPGRQLRHVTPRTSGSDLEGMFSSKKGYDLEGTVNSQR